MKHKRLTQRELHALFLEDINDYAKDIVDSEKKPLYLKLDYPFNRELKVYIFNCTAPPGGRSIDEFKIQLIIEGQKRGKRGKFDLSDNRTTLIIGYATPFLDINYGIWVLFELNKHLEFAYSANIQVYLRQMLPCLRKKINVCHKQNKEILVISQRKYLKDALQKRFEIDLNEMLERSKNGVKGI